MGLWLAHPGVVVGLCATRCCSGGSPRADGCSPCTLHPPPHRERVPRGAWAVGDAGTERRFWSGGRSGGERGGRCRMFDRGLHARIVRYISRPRKPHWKVRVALRRDGAGTGGAAQRGASRRRLTKQTNSIAHNELRLRAEEG